MDYRSAILLALGRIKLDVWNVEAGTDTVNAIVDRASQGPIYVKEAVYIANAFPPYVNAATPPISQYTASAPSSFAPNVREGIVSWYWNNTVLPNGNLVTALYQYQIDGPGAVSAWMFTGGYSMGTTWTGFSPVFIDNKDVAVTSNGLAIKMPHFSFALAVTNTAFTLALVSTDNQFECTLTATTARGPTFEQPNGNVSRTGKGQNAYWSVVDGVASGSLRNDSGSVAFSNAWSWLDYQQIGTQPLSSGQQFMLAWAGAVTTQPWMWVIVQTESQQVALFFSGQTKLQQLADGKQVTAGTTNVWVTGQAAQLNTDVKATARVVDFQTVGGTKVPSTLAVTLDSQTTYHLTCNLAGLPEVFMPNTHTYDAVCSVVLEGGGDTERPPSALLQWRSTTFPVSEIVAQTTVSSALTRASRPSSFARMNVSFGVVSGALLVAIITLFIILVVRYKQHKNIRDYDISLLVLTAVLIVIISVAAALFEKQTQKETPLRKKCIQNALKYSVTEGPSSA